jgi:hypothetical protein
MGLWITTRQLLLRQDAKSSHTRSQESGELGLLTGSMDTHLVPPCIITGVKMYTSRQRSANASWILLNYFPQLSNATAIIHRPVTNGSQRHDGLLPESSSRCPLRQRRERHHSGPCGSSGDFQTQITTSSVLRDSSFASQSCSTPKPHSHINPNIELAYAQHAANEMTDNNSHSRHPQWGITSEGGHTYGTTSFTYEGAHWLPATLASQPVSR